MGNKVRNAKNKRAQLLEQQNSICALCGNLVKEPTIDHIVPRSKGGSNGIENLQVVCRKCNNNKGNTTQNIFYTALKIIFVNANNCKFIEPDDKLKNFLYQNLSSSQVLHRESKSRSIRLLVVNGKNVIFCYNKNKKQIKVHFERKWEIKERQIVMRVYPECHLNWNELAS